jgi:hypothetical protein
VEFIGTRVTIPHFFFKWFSFRLQYNLRLNIPLLLFSLLPCLFLNPSLI